MKTLKYFILIAVIVSAGKSFGQQVAPASAPYDTRNDLLIGLKAGINYSNLYDTKGQNFTYTPAYGWVGGVSLSVPISTFFGIQPEALLSQKGFSGQGTEPDGSFSFADRENFLDVPILFQFKPIPELYILGGPEYSYLLSNIYTFNNGATSTTTVHDFDNDNLRRNIFGLMFGLDVNFNFITLGGRVAWDLQDNSGNGSSSLPRYRNAWGQLTLGVRL